MTYPGPNAVAALRNSHDELLALCGRLEEIADSLPANIDRQLCLHVARAVQPAIMRAHALEESILFPALAAENALLADMPAVLERLRVEHCEDECFAEEVQDELLALGRGDSRLVLDATGYMLRGFFEGIKRHVAQEQMLLGALIERSPVERPEAIASSR